MINLKQIITIFFSDIKKYNYLSVEISLAFENIDYFGIIDNNVLLSRIKSAKNMNFYTSLISDSRF